MADAARELGIPLDQPPSVNAEEARARIVEADPEVVCVCAFGALIKEPLLSAHDMLNVHPSLLPRWRGAAPIERAIDAGDTRTGVAIMRLVAELDAGPVCLQGEEPIHAGDDFGSLSGRLAAMGGDLLVEALDRRPPCHDQPAKGATYAEKIGAEDRRLDPGRPGVELERRVRALRPHVGAYVELPGGERLGVHAARLSSLDGAEQGSLVVSADRLLLGTAEGALELLEVQPPGGRAMEATAYLRGHARALGAG